MIDGRLFIFDAEVRSREICDRRFCHSLLEQIIDRAGMRVLEGPFVFQYDDLPPLEDGDDNNGVTGVAVLGSRVIGVSVLGTSSASIHSWPVCDLVSVDLHSCAKFEHVAVLEFLKDVLRPKSFAWDLIKRGQAALEPKVLR